ncbi:hypothetical protein KL921_000698 [Ogataea angusta]|uniref:Copper transport protein n=1 Tax=Pichia angusta TaxID=870730 RepID=A0AAN6DKM0_PICAN|nr:uncharacterized protein KL928_000865 [Ogataea angusta]KAG7813152.1 hypothetical protein KL921_000698 [Ogataea angusta]KAG7820781.1 hypothetical protein KL928_000865 [Ogataea angusta]KAG7826519.1 hypothetical protein KL909_000571 [Ogataea angusta]KAG7854567.1 hypothetical protein KL939_004840 [Ogataea angusta]KAG7863379.1 hypothetical protein KL919_000694 [Ogataea angusta]
MNMDMGSSSSSSSSGMHMHMASATSSMDMATASSTSSMDMDMSMDMSMNYYLTTQYHHYPVIFHTLRAGSGAGAFGIFCVLFFGAVFFRGLFFLSAYLEQRVFHNLTNAVLIQEIDNCACDPEEDQKTQPTGATSATGAPGGTLNAKSLGLGKIVKQTFCPGLGELKRDFIRLLIAFTAAMFGYALMLAAMSFVLLYFFAICLGMAFGEIFFNRLSIVLGINKNSSLCGSLH